MGATVVELYHWFRMYYFFRYGLPVDHLNYMYRLMVFQTAMLYELLRDRYTARIELNRLMTPREQYLYKLKLEMGK